MESRIANIVAKTEIGQSLDLDRLKLALANSEYARDESYALIYRLRKPKLSVLVNASGKIIFVGAQSLDDIETARQLLFDDLASIGYQPEKREISIQNIVVVCRVRDGIDIQRVLRSNDQYTLEYDPQNFPGIIFRNSDPRFVALVFSSGKVCVVGLKDPDYIESALEIVSGIVDGDNKIP